MRTIEDVNAVTLVCRLTADPELRSLASGQSVCSMRVAFNTSRKDPTTNTWEDQGNFVNVTVWGAHGETCAKYLTKGKRAILKGRLQWREWESEQGKRSEVSIVADRVQFLEAAPVASQPSHPVNAPAETEETVPF